MPLIALPREIRDFLRAGLDLVDTDAVNSAPENIWRLLPEEVRTQVPHFKETQDEIQSMCNASEVSYLTKQ